MERLHFGADNRYNGLEAAIHTARYSFVKAACAGKRVLDIACGEGYGAHLMSAWGAEQVWGVDISPTAIEDATRLFGSERVKFMAGDAGKALELFENERFDLIVSFETIEHVAQPEHFLADIKQLLRPGGTIVISCPNDWWYFPDPDSKNPYHLRKYHFPEFVAQTETVLGPAHSWHLGGPLVGFCNLPLSTYSRAEETSGQELMLEAAEARLAQMLPAEYGAGPQPANASYFIGVWRQAADGDDASFGGAALLPLSMDAFRTGIFKGHWVDHATLLQQLAQKDAEIASLRQQLEGDLAQKVRNGQLRIKALQLEAELTREGTLFAKDEIHQLQREIRQLQLEAHRYRQLRRLVPQPLRAPMLHLIKKLKETLRQ